MKIGSAQPCLLADQQTAAGQALLEGQQMMPMPLCAQHCLLGAGDNCSYTGTVRQCEDSFRVEPF